MVCPFARARSSRTILKGMTRGGGSVLAVGTGLVENRKLHIGVREFILSPPIEASVSNTYKKKGPNVGQFFKRGEM